jgi:RNA polymerase sigma factor (sigma-70 family)
MMSELTDFHTKYRVGLEQPIMKEFLRLEENRTLLNKHLQSPSKEEKEELDRRFKAFYKKLKTIKYINSLIRMYAIDYDKRLKKQNTRNLLILDAPLTYHHKGEETTLANTMKAAQQGVMEREPYQYGRELKEQIAEDWLYKALESLTPKQLKVLELLYVHQVNRKDIAIQLGSSRQNISNIHSKAIKKLRRIYTEEEKMKRSDIVRGGKAWA